MPSGKYYRTQAQLFARLAATTSDPHIAWRYTTMALEQLAKAEDVEPNATEGGPTATGRGRGADIDRD